MTKFIAYLQSWVASHEKDEEGATMVEYGLLVAFIALVALVGVKALGVNLNNLFSGISF
jgi:pilus assembly protein Flp/PilA